MVLDETFLMPYEIADTPLTAGLKERGWWVDLSWWFCWAQRGPSRGLALCQMLCFWQFMSFRMFQMISDDFRAMPSQDGNASAIPWVRALLSKQHKQPTGMALQYVSLEMNLFAGDQQAPGMRCFIFWHWTTGCFWWSVAKSPRRSTWLANWSIHRESTWRVAGRTLVVQMGHVQYC